MSRTVRIVALSLGAALAAGCATGGALGDLKAFTATDFAQAAQLVKHRESAPLSRFSHTAATPDGRFLLFTSDAPLTLQAVVQLAQKEACAIHSLNVRSASLEDVFIVLTGRKLRD